VKQHGKTSGERDKQIDKCKGGGGGEGREIVLVEG
jgi:hypothetical protein